MTFLPTIEKMKLRLTTSTLLKAAKRNKKLALKILKEIPFSHYNSKIIRAVLRLLFTRQNS